MSYSITGGILGQSNSPGISGATIYTVPANATSTVSITICNRTSTAPSTYSISITHGVTTTYLRYNESISQSGSPGDYEEIRALLLSAGDVVTVYSGAGGTVDFTISGYSAPATMTTLDS